MMQPLISFIVPVYKAEKYLGRCIQSILNQKINDWEIILVDDESPDRSGIMCEDYAKSDSRIRVIHRKNGGQGAARNTGAKEAEGKWLMFVDDDDWLDENMAEECVEYLNDEIDILVFSRKDVYKKNSKNRKLNLPSEELWFETTEKKHLLQVNMLNSYAPDKYGLNKVLFGVPWGKFFQRTFWQKNQLAFIEGYGEDRPCLLKAYGCARKILYLNKCYYNYWIHESTLRKYLESAKDRYDLSLASVHEYANEHFKNDPAIIEALRHTDIAYFSYYVMQDYCHRSNPQPYRQRKDRFQHDIKKDTFEASFKKADLSCLPLRRKVMASLIRSKNFYLLNMASRLNDIWNRFTFNNG